MQVALTMRKLYLLCFNPAGLTCSQVNPNGSLNQGAAPASSEPIFKVAPHIEIFKRKMAAASEFDHWRLTNGSCGRSHSALPLVFV